jgi:hypothetical protein
LFFRRGRAGPAGRTEQLLLLLLSLKVNENGVSMGVIFTFHFSSFSKDLFQNKRVVGRGGDGDKERETFPSLMQEMALLFTFLLEVVL